MTDAHLSHPLPQRLWTIEEQVVHEGITGFTLEFTSEPSADGSEDVRLVLNIWNEAKTRKLRLAFDRGGWWRRELTDSFTFSGADSVETTAGHATTPIDRVSAD